MERRIYIQEEVWAEPRHKATGKVMPEESVASVLVFPADSICRCGGTRVARHGWKSQTRNNFAMTVSDSELQAQLESDHARSAVTAQTDTKKSGWGRCGVGQSAEAGLG